MNILLIHGLGRTPLSMWSMGQALRSAHHTTESFGYMALRESFDEIVVKLRDRLQSLSVQSPSKQTPSTHSSYGVVTHSMGAILLRAALADAPFSLPLHVVMLAPPNQSPRLARIASQVPPFLWLTGQSGKNLASTHFYAKLPALACPYTIITGNVGLTGSLSLFGAETNDLVVGAEESKMHLYDKPIEVSALHSFIMNNKRAQEATISAFSAA